MVGLDCPNVIVCRPASIVMSALEKRSMPRMQGTCRLSMKVKLCQDSTVGCSNLN